MQIAEIIRSYLGWCPNKMITPVMKEAPWRETESRSVPTQGTYMNDELIVDYGSTGISLPFFIGGIIAGLIGIFVTVFTLIVPVVFLSLLAAIIWCGLIFSVAIVIFYQDLKKASLEITREAFIIRRVLHRPVVIRKDTIASMEVRYNVPPVPFRLQKVLFLFVIPVSSAVVILGETLQFASGEIAASLFFQRLSFDIGIAMLVLALYYHSRVRMQYPEILIVTTTTKKLAGIYGKNPEEIEGILVKSA